VEEARSNARLSANILAPEDWPPAEIEVYWHVVVANETYEGGWIPPEQLAMQMQVLNQDYALARLSFKAILVTRIVNAVWFNDIIHSVVDTALQDSLKRKYRKGDGKTLNVYTVSFSQDETLGYATFPFEYEEFPDDDGVIIRYNTTPGSDFVPYHLGRTLTHEVGHWVGLFHTFQGESCFGPGDGVADTPAQLTETSGCPRGKDTCPGDVGLDPINNFMDYSYDICLDSFTPGQVDRLRTNLAYYRGVGIPSV
jgi:hypothetical protein